MDFSKWASSDPSPSPLQPLPHCTFQLSRAEPSWPPCAARFPTPACGREGLAPRDMREVRAGSGPCVMQERQSAGPLPDSKRRRRPVEDRPMEDACNRKTPRSLHKGWRPSPAMHLEACGLSFPSHRDVTERHASCPSLWAKGARTEFKLLGHGEKLPKCDEAF